MVPNISHGPPHSCLFPATIAIDPVTFVRNECLSIISTMRKNARWSISGVTAILAIDNTPFDSSDDTLASKWGLQRNKPSDKGPENALLTDFVKLKNHLAHCSDLSSFDTAALFHPFLQVILSPSVSGSITTSALISISKFLNYGIVTPTSFRIQSAMYNLSSAITNCRFEASDSTQDDIVLLRILNLMDDMLSSDCGQVLSDDSICEMMATGLSMCCQIKLTEMLRSSAEMTMLDMCRCIFEQFRLVPDPGGNTTALSPSTATANSNIPLDKTTKSPPPPPDAHNGQNSLSISIETSSEISEKTLADDGTVLVSSAAGANADHKPEDDLVATADSDEAEKATAPSSASESNQAPPALAPEIQPYGIMSVYELLRALISILDKRNLQYTDSMRCISLKIIHVAFEVAGPTIIEHPILMPLIQDYLCACLFQLARLEYSPVLVEALRVCETVFYTIRSHLKLQQEYFLSYTLSTLKIDQPIPQEPGIDAIIYEAATSASQPPSSAVSSRTGTPIPGTPNNLGNAANGVSNRSDTTSRSSRVKSSIGNSGGSGGGGNDNNGRRFNSREALVETICRLALIPSFTVELYVNYDADINRSDLFHDLVNFLSRHAFPDAAEFSTQNVPPLCLDALLNNVSYIADRIENGTKEGDGLPDPEMLRLQREKKKIIDECAQIFNRKPKEGIKFLKENHLVDNVDDVEQIAEFLKNVSCIQKAALGDYLGRPENQDVMGAFIGGFNFSNLRVDEALRILLSSFRLPGESQIIERLMNRFSEVYYASHSQDFVDKDGVFVLSYSVIMLNTDLHNPQIKTHMSLTSYRSILREIIEAGTLPEGYIEDIYSTIRDKEIIMPEEHDTSDSFEYLWRDLVGRLPNAGVLTRIPSNVSLYDADIFEITWRPVVAALSYVFVSATDDTVFHRVISGFDQCARIAAHYGIYECLDHLVACLASISTLAVHGVVDPESNVDIQVDSNRLTVSRLSIAFGKDFKAQLATVVLFRIVTNHAHAIRKGWQQVALMLKNIIGTGLFVVSLPDDIQAKLGIGKMPSMESRNVIRRSDGRESIGGGSTSFTSGNGSNGGGGSGGGAGGGGIFSTLSQYLSSYGGDESSEPTDEELEITLCSVDCIASCDLDGVVGTIVEKLKGGDIIDYVVKALIGYHEEVDTPSRSSLASVRSQVTDNSKGGSSSQMSTATTIGTGQATIFGQQRPSFADAKDTRVNFADVNLLELGVCVLIGNPDYITSHGDELLNQLETTMLTKLAPGSVLTDRIASYMIILLRYSGEIDQDKLNRTFGFLIEQAERGRWIPKKSGNVTKSILELVNNESLCFSNDKLWQLLEIIIEKSESNGDVIWTWLEKSINGDLKFIDKNYLHILQLLNRFAILGSIGAKYEQGNRWGEDDDEGDKRQHQQQMEQNVKRTRHVVKRATRSINLVNQMMKMIPKLSSSSIQEEEEWDKYYYPAYKLLEEQSVNVCRQVRNSSFGCLQRNLITDSTSNRLGGRHDEEKVFDKVLFPLTIALLQPEAYELDPKGMGDSRSQAASLLCKIFLTYLSSQESTSTTTTTIERRNKLIELWLKILDMMDRLMNSGQRDNLEEAVPESVKNVLLVMTSLGVFGPPSKSGDDNNDDGYLWNETWNRVSRFSPTLKHELFPSE